MHTVLSGVFLKIWNNLLNENRVFPVDAAIIANKRCDIFPFTPHQDKLTELSTYIPSKTADIHTAMPILPLLFRDLFSTINCICKPTGIQIDRPARLRLGLQDFHSAVEHYQFMVKAVHIFSRLLDR